MKKIIIVLLVFLSLHACKKDDLPPEGLYLGTFSGTYWADGIEKINTRVVDIQITETSKNELVFWHSENGESGRESILTKKGHDVSGTIATWSSWGSSNGQGDYFIHTDKHIEIEGRWEKSNKEYIITGNFTSIYSFVKSIENINANYPVEGTFIIKPKNE